MIILTDGKDIEYTKGDTFSINVYSDEEIESNSQLDFIITANEDNEPIISNTYNLNAQNEFTVSLSNSDIAKLKYADYIYKLVLHTPEGDILTQKSGNFKTKWGA